MNLRWIGLTGMIVTVWAVYLPVAPADEPPAVLDFIVIDDFESYTDDEGALRIYEVWIDGWGAGPDKPGNGTGSTVGYFDTGYHPNMVHGGRQAMPLEYNNVGTPYYSEVYRTWDVPQNWTANSVAELSLWLRGWPASFLEKPEGQIVMSGSGYDLDKHEGFRYAYKELAGDGEIVVRIDTFSGAAGWAGIMIRETVDPRLYPAVVKYAAIVVTPGNGVSFMYRRATNEQRERNDMAGIQTPCWVRLSRSGDTFLARFSTDGSVWQDVIDAGGTALAANIAMQETMYVGLCVTSGKIDSTAVAKFSHVGFAGDISEPWQVAAINTDDLSNSPDTVYIALEDATGAISVAKKPDAVNITEWTEWRTTLRDFSSAGVDLKTIQKMYIGIGNRNDPQRNGRGRIFIDDIRLLRRVRAADPYPAHGDVNVPQSLVLRWSPGNLATYHDIYFGADPNAVANATTATADIYRGRHARNETTFDPGPLDWNRTCYWRIDEVNDANPESPWKGEVWRFTTADFLIVDDFESFPDDDTLGLSRLYPTWIDGWADVALGGSTVGNWDPPFMEQDIVHGGLQSMPMDYNNIDPPYFSQAYREFRPAQDWTVNGVDTLVLFARGRATNAPAPMYLSVEDSAGTSDTADHPDPQLTLATEWMQWKVPLSNLADVDATRVKRLYIGAGSRTNPSPGGTGRIYIDDIRVIKSTSTASGAAGP